MSMAARFFSGVFFFLLFFKESSSLMQFIKRKRTVKKKAVRFQHKKASHLMCSKFVKRHLCVQCACCFGFAIGSSGGDEDDDGG